jgi:hypothetical protein
MQDIEGMNVAKKRGAPKKPGGVGRHTRLDPDVVAMAKVIAPYKGVAIQAYLSDILRVIVRRGYAIVTRRQAEEEK